MLGLLVDALDLIITGLEFVSDLFCMGQFVHEKLDAKRQRLRWSRGRCPTCGYDLRGTVGEKCSECGLDLSEWRD